MWRRGWVGAGFITGLVALSASIAPDGPAEASSPTADDGATVIGERFRGRRTLDLTIRSPVLAMPVQVRLLLPRGWSRDGRRTWPVLWLLAGAGGAPAEHTSWTANTDVERMTEDSGVIVVMPAGGRCGNYTDWWNHGKAGPPKWETFHLTEVRQILERGYRAGTARAVAGSGMGGMGAMAYAARHRGLFRAAASFSGPLHTLHRDDSGLDVADLIELGVAIGCPAADWTDVWGDPEVQRVVWRQHNPYELVDRLSGVRLYVSAGDGSPGPYDPQPGTDPDILEALAHRVGLEFTGKLKKLGIPASTHFYRGTHSWPYWQRELEAALPVMLAEIA
ncbi:esterase family protein [Actinomadura barringtoniae]|uniref:Esterase family protein n=1 Tax=Actinomadura barringtoniae TaxID=1427535 RepID=A0A939PS61_9ACTN|nr:alpha/beta hydrolase-fold protein [Actinomadura barringtoniae]MBO2453781.1 esterase family protein [Actinomadura barringtoniae]